MQRIPMFIEPVILPEPSFTIIPGIKTVKQQDKNKYSEEDMISFAHFYFQEEFNSSIQTSKPTDKIFKEWFEQFKKK